ncbi:hypothetical protein CC79DRAFT_1393013 [Sarocladium strictum]
MFGTLHLSPSETGPIYVEKADSATFNARECHVPLHTACDQCRLKKLRCNGGKPRCNRCSTSSAVCGYSEMTMGTTRRHRESRRSTRRNAVTDADALASTQADSGSVQPVSSNTQDSAIGENGGLPNLGHDAMSELERHDALNVDAASAARQDGLLSMDVDSNNLADFQLLPGLESPGPSFNWSPFNGHDLGLPSPLVATGDNAINFATTGSGTKCRAECLGGMESLLEELEACLHDMGPCKADAALAFQKRAYWQCFQIVNCHTCYLDPDAMMLLTMICDKMVMLNKKILWYTKEDSHVEEPLTVGEYEMDRQEGWAGVVRVLTAVQLRKVKQLVDRIEASPAIQDKQAQIIVLRSVKQQVIALLRRVKAAITARMFDA